jgi:hypothetical protein
MDIKSYEGVIAVTHVGSGSKAHIVEVIVEDSEVRFGRQVTKYTAPRVYCGSQRGMYNTAWGVDEISDRYEVQSMVTRQDKNYAGKSQVYKINIAARNAVMVGALEKAQQKYGAGLCMKCERDYQKVVDRINKG